MTRPPSCLTEIAFSALLQYSPYGEGQIARASCAAVVWIKRGRPTYVERIGVRATECNAANLLGGVFSRDTILVPVPRSEPQRSGALWPALRIAAALCQHGLGGEVRPLLVRREAIVKSALRRVGSLRPGPIDHMRTIALSGELPLGIRRLTLVDDVVTRGATLLGCASLLSRAFPDVQVSSFAAVRAMSDAEIETMLAPICGKITFDGNKPHREP